MTRHTTPYRFPVSAIARLVLLAAALLAAASGRAEPVDIDIPAQPADGALMAFARQAKAEVIFSFDDLHKAVSPGFTGRGEAEHALNLLLRGTGFAAQRNLNGRFVVARIGPPQGSIKGRLVAQDGRPARAVHVVIPLASLAIDTDLLGEFEFDSVVPGTYQLFATGLGYQTLQIDDAHAFADRVLDLGTLAMQPAREPAQLEPFVVEAKSEQSPLLVETGMPPAPRTAVGDLDQPRTQNDTLSYTVFSREQIARSGMVDLNDFLKQELLDSDATTLPPEQNGRVSSFASGSTNLNLRGYGADATIILVDGRRLPEVVTALPANLTQGTTAPQSDVNVIPISMIERIEVLPVSSSAIYSGSPVGGVINIVLRPEINATEFTTTYTNALSNYDAPQVTASLLNGETLLGGALRLRFDATFTSITPPTEAELGYIRTNLAAHPQAEGALYRATPNVSSADGQPLFGAGTPAFTSVAPGADGSGGLASFEGRQGVQSLALYQAPGGGLTDTPNGLDSPFGRQEKSMSLFGSATYDVTRWLQVGLDASAGRTVNHTGYSVFAGNLSLPSGSPLNPFHQDVNVTLNETAPDLGANYDEAHIDYYSAVLGLLLRLPAGWQASIDAQYGLSVTNYRGIEGVDTTRWQQLVDEGIYNPLRDTQVFGPPPAFYDRALIFYGRKGDFVTLGDYDTFDSSIRVANPTLTLPTGTGTVTVGGDYRYARLGDFVDELAYGDGSLVASPGTWVGRSLQRVSAFGEFQAPLLPQRWVPRWIRDVETDLAVRYTASDLANEANVAPTAAIKIDFPEGFSLRGTYATSNRFPPPFFSSFRSTLAGSGGSGAVVPMDVFDPKLQMQETVSVSDATNPNLAPEAAVTQTAGFLFDRGTVHHFRVSVDFINTVTSGEETYLNSQQVVDLEGIFPDRVLRAPAGPGEDVGPITSVFTGNFNLAWRHSYEWNTALDYDWTECHGGTLEAYCRWIYFQRYDLELLPTSGTVDELRDPDGTTPGLLKHRMNFGAGWSNRRFGFGIDGHYFHSRILPDDERISQGSDQVNPYWQFDAYLQGDIARWLPWKSSHYGVRGQLRVNNLLGKGPPRYADDPTGAGVQEYGDWRGRVYSLSVTVSY